MCDSGSVRPVGKLNRCSQLTNEQQRSPPLQRDNLCDKSAHASMNRNVGHFIKGPLRHGQMPSLLHAKSTLARFLDVVKCWLAQHHSFRGAEVRVGVWTWTWIAHVGFDSAEDKAEDMSCLDAPAQLLCCVPRPAL